MKKEEIELIQDTIHNIMMGNSAKYEAALDLINYKLDEIKIQTTKHNGRMEKIENKIITLEKNESNHIINCPQKESIKTMQKQLDAQTSVKSFVWKAITITGVVIGMLFTFLKLIGQIA